MTKPIVTTNTLIKIDDYWRIRSGELPEPIYNVDEFIQFQIEKEFEYMAKVYLHKLTNIQLMNGLDAVTFKSAPWWQAGCLNCQARLAGIWTTKSQPLCWIESDKNEPTPKGIGYCTKINVLR